MNGRKRKLIQVLTAQAIVSDKEGILKLCRNRAEQRNINGGRQHKVINPRRQAKKLVMRQLNGVG